jgi:tRNA-splicing ligase RtcB (3'-phosphate/5'-hydroxy nucleic acid ligase)
VDMSKWREVLQRIDQYRWKLPRAYKSCMKTDGIIFANDVLMDILREEEAVEQVANVACLPGIVGRSLAMPDIHWGYGFPVGGVAAFDSRDGVISPGGIGYDINCGVRMLKTNLSYDDVKDRVEDLVRALFITVPCGVGKSGRIKFKDRREISKVLADGARWAIKNGYGLPEDLEYTEANGCLHDADPDAVSDKAVNRGLDQIGTLGSGNHFLEIQVVDEIYDEEAAGAFGVDKNMITVMIHTGSRGLGHQVATDYLSILGRVRTKYNIEIPDRQLACAPINSEEGKAYWGAMAASANFAWANRQVIAHWVREAFERVLKTSPLHLGMEQVYDVAHNIAKFEDYEVDKKMRKLCIHRKGATRSFGPGSPELPQTHRRVGQAVIIPGDMGRYSFLMAGTDESAKLSFSSTCHGAGRVMSRGEAKKKLKGRNLVEELEKKDIFVKGVSWTSLAEEAPEAYKDVAEVVETAHGAGLARKVARLRPVGVMKG